MAGDGQHFDGAALDHTCNAWLADAVRRGPQLDRRPVRRHRRLPRSEGRLGARNRRRTGDGVRKDADRFMTKPYLVPPAGGGLPSDLEDLHAAISPIEEIIEDARNGRPYILVDAEDRENEGDVIIPAQFATPAQINFMAKHARGLVCLSINAERARQLRLPPMAWENQSGH